MQTLNNLLLLAKVFWRHFQTSDSEISLLVEVHKPVSPPKTTTTTTKNTTTKNTPHPVQCCFTSTETIRLIRTATLTSAQLLSSENPHPALESTYKYSFVHFSLLKNDTSCSSVGEIPICWRNNLMPDVLRPLSSWCQWVQDRSHLFSNLCTSFLCMDTYSTKPFLVKWKKAITSFYCFAVTFI